MTIETFFRQYPDTAVAVSGGVDSAWLLHEALRCGRQTAAFYVRTAFQPDFEEVDARDTAKRLGIPLTVLELDILSVPEVVANPADRCYYCKRALFACLLDAARAGGFPLVLDGSNASDDVSERPGMRALAELGVRSPLRECGLTKSLIRALAHEAGLPVWNKPSYACLATRIPTGVLVTPERLSRIAAGERHIAAAGFSDFRLRLQADGVLLQVTAEQMEQARRLLPALLKELAPLFPTVRLDAVPRIPRES